MIKNADLLNTNEKEFLTKKRERIEDPPKENIIKYRTNR